ncbi:MAG: HPP family protein [Gallionellaceae bacterium]|nr:MAG: HPP family protein [Gallionellaceae bacterium]
MNLSTFIKSFIPHKTSAPFLEKVRSGLAGGIAILLLAWVLYALPQHSYQLLMLGSMAASAVLLFASPHSPFAQPWNLVGGHLVSALAGWVCIVLIPDPAIAAGVAVGIAIFLMHYLNCLHPPGAATALTLVLAGGQFHEMGWQWVAMIVIANTFISLILALLINNVLPGRRYPFQAAPMPPKLEPALIPEPADIEWALRQMDSVIDVNPADLAVIYAKAQAHAKDRLDSQLEKN